jgi:hypothetical protein
LSQLLEEFQKKLHMKLCQKGIFPTASSIKHLVELFLAYAGKKKPEIIVSPSFFHRSTFRQTVLKTVLSLSKKLLRGVVLAEAEAMPKQVHR